MALIAKTGVHVQGLPRPIRVFLAVLLSSTAVCLGIEGYWRFFRHLLYPYNWPLASRGAAFCDLLFFQERFRFFHSARFFTNPGFAFTYPAPMALLYWCLYHLPRPAWAFCALLLLLVLMACSGVFQTLTRTYGATTGRVLFLLVSLVLCSQPLFFELEQGNLEPFVVLLVSLGIWAFLRKHSLLAAIFFGVAGAMKLFPFLFLALLFSRRQYRQIIYGGIFSGAVSLASFWAVCPQIGVSYKGIRAGLIAFREFFVIHYSYLNFDHSLFSVIKFLELIEYGGFPGHSLPAPGFIASLLLWYMVFAASVATLLYFLFIRRLPVVNQVLCLTLCSILLPPVSYEYTLLHLYAPWLLLVLVAFDSVAQSKQETRSFRGTKVLTAMLVCFALVFAPNAEFIVRGLAYGGQLKAIVLVILFLLGMIYRLPSRFDLSLEQAERPRSA